MTAPAHRPTSDAHHHAERTLHVVQGQFHVTREPSVSLSTILGSCVAACFRDPVSGVGGMNHFLLPGDQGGDSDALKYGVNAMELLINALLKQGAVRSRLECKLFGGARVIANLSDIGAQNAAFALRFLETEGIPCVAQSLGGNRARRLRYWPQSGRATQLFLDKADARVLSAERPVRVAAPPPASGSIELF